MVTPTLLPASTWLLVAAAVVVVVPMLLGETDTVAFRTVWLRVKDGVTVTLPEGMVKVYLLPEPLTLTVLPLLSFTVTPLGV